MDFEPDIPDGAVDGSAEAELLKVYADGRVTTGETADMLGLTRIQFYDLLGRSGVGFRVDLDDEDFAQLRRRREEFARDGGQ